MPSLESAAPPDGPDGSRISLEAILTASPYVFCAVDPDGTIQRINAAAEATLGYGEEEIRGHSLLSLVHPEDRPKASRAAADAGEATEGPVMLRLESASGHRRTIGFWFHRDAGSGLVLTWGDDVTESRAVREELRVRIEILERILAERTRALAEVETRFEDVRRRGPDEPASGDPGSACGDRRSASIPDSVSFSRRLRADAHPRHRTPYRPRETKPRRRFGSPPRMTMAPNEPSDSRPTDPKDGPGDDTVEGLDSLRIPLPSS